MKKILSAFFISILLLGYQQAFATDFAAETVEERTVFIACNDCGRKVPYTLSQLDDIIAKLDPDFSFDVFGFWVCDLHQYLCFDEFEVFHAIGIMRHNTILVHRFSDDSWHLLSLGEYEFQNVISISPAAENPSLISISVDGWNFGIDYIIQDFPRTLTFDKNFENPEIIYYNSLNADWNEVQELGDTISHEELIFCEIETLENEVRFHFDLAGKPVGNGHPIPYITFRNNSPFEYEVLIYFHNIKNKLTDQQLSAIRQSLGNSGITTKYYDDADTFAGVLLKIPYTYDHESYDTDLPIPSIILTDVYDEMIFVLQRNEQFSKK